MHWSPDCLNTGLNATSLLYHISSVFYLFSGQVHCDKWGCGVVVGEGYTCTCVKWLLVRPLLFFKWILHGR